MAVNIKQGLSKICSTKLDMLQNDEYLQILCAKKPLQYRKMIQYSTKIGKSNPFKADYIPCRYKMLDK